MSHQPGTFISGTLFDLFYMIYVDYGAFFFESRTDIEKGITLLSHHFARFGLEMHIGMGKNLLKTEFILFPPTGFFVARTLPLTDLTNSTLALQEKKLIKRDAHVRTKNIPSAETSSIKVK